MNGEAACLLLLSQRSPYSGPLPPGRNMRTLRRYYQAFFRVLFFVLLFLAAQERLRGYPVTIFLDASPLNGLSTLLASWNVAHTMWIGFAVLALSLLLGRFFCGWICPLGTILQIVSWIFRSRSIRERIERNEYVAAQSFKYALLVVLLACAALGGMQAGLFDPMALLTRTSAVFLAPAASSGLDAVAGQPLTRVFPTAPLVVAIFALILLLNAYRPRFWCRYICPLGALLGVAAKFSFGAFVRDETKCTNCGLCSRDCAGACNPHKETRACECFVCWNCVNQCPENALKWQWLPNRQKMSIATDISRRLFLGSLGGGIAAFFSLRLAGSTRRRGFEKRIRPPGALAEDDFLARCLKCGECVKVCPTNAIQPSLTQAGLEGLWTPVLDMRFGYCELNCTLCGQVHSLVGWARMSCVRGNLPCFAKGHRRR